jgi:hypothetical protein
MFCYQFKKPFIVISLLSVGIVCFTPHAHAEFEYDISPILHLQEQYDDNINLTSSSKKSDSISKISPGFSLLLSHPRFKVTCDYLHTLAYFKNNPQYDYNNGNTLNFNLETRLTEYLNFLFTENYERSNDPQLTEFSEQNAQQTGQQNVQQTGLQNSVSFRSLHTQNNISPHLEYRFGPEDTINLTYRNTRLRQEGLGSEDYTENFYDGGLTYWLNDNYGINLQYSQDRGNFQVQENDFKSNRIAPRLTYRFSRQAEVFLDYSYTGTDFNHQTNIVNNTSKAQQILFPLYVGTDLNQQLDTNPDYFVRDFDAGFKLSPLSTVKVEGKLGYYWRIGHDSTNNQGFIYRLWGEKQLSSGSVFMDYRGGATANYFAVRDSGFYEFWLVSTGYAYNYKNILTFRADGSFTNYDYIQAPLEKLQNISQRKDDVWQGNILLGYNITSFLAFEIEYNYFDQSSNRKTDSYIDNRITGRLVINFLKDYQKGH